MNKLDKLKFTEGEITSMVRRFFIANGFSFLSSSKNGDKLYYTLPDNASNFKQPDSIVIKDDLIILCEDKIFYRSLYSSNSQKISDFEKLSLFLNSSNDLNLFSSKVPKSYDTDKLKIIGCLSSLASNGKNNIVLPVNLIKISILKMDKSGSYLLELKADKIYSKYFEKKILELIL